MVRMPYTIEEFIEDGVHIWVVVRCSCDINDKDDTLIAHTVDLVRRSYGEASLLLEAEKLLTQELQEGVFELQHLQHAIRLGLPDPAAEGRKPLQLTNFRSQAAEMVAKGALAKAFHFQYPAAPQQGTSNPNQPVLGFDSWGLIQEPDGQFALVLIQVKATDQQKCPPDEVHKLVEECKQVPRSMSPLARGLTVLAQLLTDPTMKKAVLRMLEGLGRGELPRILVAPVVVRGTTSSERGDLDPLKTNASDLHPVKSRGATVSIGAGLADFGRVVMERARAA